MNSKMRKTNVIILGAGKPKSGSDHSALRETTRGSKVLDWLIQAFDGRKSEFQFVGGYKFQEIKNRYKGLKYIENDDWDKMGATGSLFKAELPDSGDLFVSYSDILYRKEIVTALHAKEGEVIIAIDTAWKNRYQGRLANDLKDAEKVFIAEGNVTKIGTDIDSHLADAEFIGLVKFDEKVLNKLGDISQETSEKIIKTNLSGLLEWLRVKGVGIKVVDAKGDWAELDDPRDLTHFILGTKAETLERLRPMVSKSIIGEQIKLNIDEWKRNKEYCLKLIKQTFGSKKIVARSSSLDEDGFKESNAGNFESVLNIDGSSQEQIVKAIDRVISSYSDNEQAHQVLIQKMLTDVAISGVAFSRTLTYGAPYYVINYDAKSGTTDSVTSGNGADLETLIYHRESSSLPKNAPQELINLLEALEELESITGHDSIDVEFIISTSGTVHILQLRPITVDHTKWSGSDRDVSKALNRAIKQFKGLQKASPFIYGDKPIFGLMPDWNPAEIIGPKPRKLAYSLYSYLVTDRIWAVQRSEYGYRNVLPHKLMQSFAGQPFIDIRGSFNSFIPKDVSEQLAEKLVNHYLNRLVNNPELHDKVEFDIVFTCMGFDFDKRKEQLKKDGFTNAEIDELRSALIDLTNSGFDRVEKDLDTISTLEKRYKQINTSELPPLKKAFALLDDCKTYGTLPFAHLARAGFVAVTLLKSAVSSGLISEGEKTRFMNSMNTVAKQYSHHLNKISNTEMSMDEFLDRYGHLRPGTYDITTPSYKNDIERYLSHIDIESKESEITKSKTFSWTSNSEANLIKGLKKNGLNENLDTVQKFMQLAIEGREYSKFIFSKNVSKALDLISEFANSLEFSKKEIAHVRLSDLEAISDGLINDPKMWLTKRVEEEKKAYELTQGIEFPPLITSTDDFYSFIYPKYEPNFVGDKDITAEVVCIDDIDNPSKSSLSGKIVLIQKADPGYDWLFGFPIAGLITEFGGANSHMAIRSAELGLPAAIGTGEEYYKRLRRAKMVTLDCINRKIKTE